MAQGPYQILGQEGMDELYKDPICIQYKVEVADVYTNLG